VAVSHHDATLISGSSNTTPVDATKFTQVGTIMADHPGRGRQSVWELAECCQRRYPLSEISLAGDERACVHCWDETCLVTGPTRRYAGKG